MLTKSGVRTAPASPKRPGRGSARRLSVSERAAAIILVSLVLLALAAFGASEIATASLFAGLYPAFLIGLLISCRWARRDLSRLRGTWAQLGLFLSLLLAVSWSLTPWGPGGAHPVWSYVPSSVGALTVDRSAVWLSLAQLLGLACLFVAARVIGASEARGRWFLRISLLAIGAYALMAFLDHVGLRRSARLTATLLSPNSAATVFGASLLFAVAATANRLRRQTGLSMLKRGDPEAVAMLGLVGLLATTLILTASRAGLAATLVGLGLFLVWEAIAQKQRLRVAVGLGLGAAILAVGALSLRSADLLSQRLNQTGQDASVRQRIFEAHWEAFQAAPWFGFGLGSFPTVNHLITTQENLRVLFDIRAAHNLYLQWLEEGGVIGALAMASLFIVLLWPIFRGGLREGAVGTWARASVCAASVCLLHGLTDFALQVPAIQALAVLILGVVGSMAAVAGPASKENPRIVWSAGVAAGAVLLVSLSMTAPLLAARLGGNLTAWPTAPAEALARQIELDLARSPKGAKVLDQLEKLSVREIGLRPASGAAWLRRAAVQAAAGRDAEASESLEHSFAVAPLQTSLFTQRTLFAYEHWDRISMSARQSETYQLTAEWARRPDPRRYITLANSLKNPVGRVGMALKIGALRLQSPIQ